MELVIAEQRVEKCWHFSIRGFVAEVRKKDRKTGWPFSCEELAEVLPPMHVPEFKYWRCENCIEHTENDDVEENVELLDLCKRGLVPCGTCSHQCVRMPPGEVEGMLLLPSEHESDEKTQEALTNVIDRSQEKIFERQRMTDACATVDVNDVEKNASVRVTKDDLLHAYKDITSDGKTANHIQVNETGNNTLLCVNITEEDVPVSEGDNVAAVNEDQFNRPEDETVTNLNQDSCPSDGRGSTPVPVYGQRKGKQVIDGSIKKPRTKKPAGTCRHNLPTTKLTGKNVETVRPVNLGSTDDEAANYSTAHAIEERVFQTFENENHTSRLDGTTGKRKRQKLRTLGNILSRCGEMEAESSSSGSGASLGFDLNLSPTHQMVKQKKITATGDEDEMSLQTSSQNNAPEYESLQRNSPNNVPKTVESCADKGQQAIVGDDREVSSLKRKRKKLEKAKGKMLEKGNGDSSSLGFHGEAWLAVEKEKEASTQRYPYSDSETVRVRGEKNVTKKNEIVNGKIPLLLSENPATGPDILQNVLGQRGKQTSEQGGNRDSEQSGNGTSEKASSDDIPIEIIELMARNLYERRLGASETNNCSLQFPSKKKRDPNLKKNPQAVGTELPMFLQEKKSQKSKLHSSSKAKATRLGYANPLIDHVAQTSNNTGRIKIIPERVHDFKEFMNQEKVSNGPQFPINISSRNCGNQAATFSKNREQAAIQAPHCVGSSSRDFGYQKSACSVNQEKPSSGAQFLFGASNSNMSCDYRAPTFQQRQDKPLTGAHILAGGSNRKPPHQNSMLSLNHEKPTRRIQLLAGSNSSADLLEKNLYPRACLQTPDAYRSQSLLWQNSCRDDPHSWSSTRPWMTPNCLPFENGILRQFNASSTISQCLELFPEGNTNGNQILKPMDPLTNHVDTRNGNIALEPSKRTRPEYPLPSRERRILFNPHSVGPVDLYNKESMPATDLLRLMDAGACPRTPVNMNKSQKLSQQCSLQSYHRQLEMSRLRQLKNNDAPPPSPPSEHFRSGKSPSIPAANQGSTSLGQVPDVNGISSTLQNTEVIKMDNWLRRSFPAKLNPDFANGPMKEKANVREIPAQSKNGSPGKNHELTPIIHMRKRFQSSPASMSSPPNSFLQQKDSTNLLEFEGKKSGRASKEKRSCRDGFCSFNRNPAEFTVPEGENEYMIIRYGDTNLKETVSSTLRTSLVKAVEHKRHKKVRFADLEDSVKQGTC